MDKNLKEIGKKFKDNLQIAQAQGTDHLATNAEMMKLDDLKPVDGTEDCHK